MSMSTLTSKGQTTIPADIRAYLKIHTGDRLEFIPLGNGRVMVIPATLTLDDLKGILPRPKKRATLTDIEKAIRTRGGRKA